MSISLLSMPPSGRRRGALVAAVATMATVLAACGNGGSGDGGETGGGDHDEYIVGIVNSYTGAFATQATDFENGFMAGLDYLTDGTMEIDGVPITVLKGDDTGETSVAATVATDHLSKDARILVGPTNSAVAIAVAELAVQNDALFFAGAAGTTETVGMHDTVFGTVGNSPAGTMIYKSVVGDAADGATIASINQDYAYGQDQAAQMTALFEPMGATVETYLLPLDTADFTPTVHQIDQLDPDFIHASWAGAGVEQLYGTLGSQGVLDGRTFFAHLYLKSSFGPVANALGDALENTNFTMFYFEGATGNEKDQHLLTYAEEHDHVVEYDDVVGWSAAEMTFRALNEGDYDDTLSMANAVKDWEFEGPQGTVMIRGEDNQVIVPWNIVKLVNEDGEWVPELVEAVPAEDLVPPVVKPINN